MKFYGITMEGKFINQSLTSFNTNDFQAERDTGRLVYNVDDGFLWWGDGTAVPPLWRRVDTGGGGDGEAEDMYSDLLRTTIFLNSTWDEFDPATGGSGYDGLLESNPNVSTMIGGYDSEFNYFEYTAGQQLVSTNLWDTEVPIVQANYVMVSVDYVSTSASPVLPSIYITANGGTNWDAITPHTVHQMGVLGNDVRLKFVANDSGILRSWAVLYNKDLSVSCSRKALTYTKTIVTSAGQNLFIADYEVGSVMVFLNGDLLDSDNDYTATDGTGVTINSPSLQIGDVVVIVSFGTSILGTGSGSGSGSLTRKIASSDGDNTVTGTFTAGSTIVYVNGISIDSLDYTISGAGITIKTFVQGGLDIYSGDIILVQSI